ncbi:MAG TPA: carboxypeptidase regulatory-like domain-containing protein [Vicinamibacterales bacterium]
MSSIYRVLAPLALTAAIAACGGSDASKSAEPASPKAAPDARRVDPATAATISGKVVLEGSVPENPTIKMSSDPACGSSELRGESYVVDNGGLKNVFVYIKDGLGNKYIFDTPTDPVKIDQKGCHYVPHVVGLRTTQPLEIVNSDNTLHNVHGMPKANVEFNQGQPVQGMKNDFTFKAPEVLIPLKCDVHAWMNAYVGVVDHPYFAVTGDGGRFELRGVPPGTYSVEAVHEKLGRVSLPVTVGEKDSKELTFTLKAQ